MAQKKNLKQGFGSKNPTTLIWSGLLKQLELLQ